jgi:hypothetical protein
MGQPFANPVVGGGGALVIPVIRSPNFSLTSETGWAIMSNGDAYFYDITIQGTFEGTDFILNSSGFFLYSGTPAAGNTPIAYISSTSTDPFGNTIEANAISSSLEGVTSLLGQGAVALTWAANAGGFGGPAATEPGGLQIEVPTANNIGPTLQIQGPSAKASGIILPVILISGQSEDGTAVPQIAIQNSDGSDIQLQLTGTIVAAPTAGIPETWHTITLDSGWSTLAGHAVPQYRMLPTGDIEFVGYASHASFTSSTNLNGSNPIPSAYRPTNSAYIKNGDGNRSAVEITSGGVIVAFPVSGGSTQIELAGIIMATGV